MTKEEYVKTLEVNGIKVDLGLDDYCQCYFIEWADKNGDRQSTSLGTYNTHYMEDIYYLFDSNYKDLSRKEIFGGLTDTDWNELNKYGKIFEEEYKR